MLEQKYMAKVKSDTKQKCSICKKEYKGYGNNAEPINDGKCCDNCNNSAVTPERIKRLGTRTTNEVELEYKLLTIEDALNDYENKLDEIMIHKNELKDHQNAFLGIEGQVKDIRNSLQFHEGL